MVVEVHFMNMLLLIYSIRIINMVQVNMQHLILPKQMKLRIIVNTRSLITTTIKINDGRNNHRHNYVINNK